MRRYPWFRMYTEARTDRKLDLLTDAEHRIWHNLLCYAAEQEERGFVPAECCDELALECARGDFDAMEAALSRLVTLRIIVSRDGGWLFRSFEDRQHDFPSDLPAETRKRKAKSRAVTSQSREVTSGHAEEEKRGEEIKTSPLSLSTPPKGVHPGALGKFEEKRRRPANEDEIRSLRIICKHFPDAVVCTAISQAFMQMNEGKSNPDDLFAFITTIAKAAS